MTAGRLAQRDPAVLANWILRIISSVVVAPPAEAVRPFIAELLLPALTP